MELKVRAVDAVEEKSVQEVEQELLEKHEEKFNDSNETTEQTPQIKMDFAEESVVVEHALAHGLLHSISGYHFVIKGPDHQ